MTGEDVRHGFDALVPRAEIARLCRPWGVLARQRQLDLGRLVRAMVISAGPPGGADQAAGRRSYLEGEVPPGARSACARWCDAPLARFMAALAERAVADARAQQVELAGPRCGVQAWESVDAPTVRGRAALREELPGTGESAAITGHTVRSVGCGAPGRYPGSPARAHDRRPLTSDESWRGDGLLAALGAASMARLRACEAPRGHVGLRRQDHGKPQVDDIAQGQVPQTGFPGTNLDARRAEAILRREGRAIAADGPVGGDQHPLGSVPKLLYTTHVD